MEGHFPPGAEGVVLKAKEDVARRLGTEVSAVRVQQVESQDWPDTSLGCPEPGRAYAQVITSGYRLVLTVGSQTYVYHTSSTDARPCDGGG